MSQKNHEYTVTIKWTGNRGTGTSAYKSYERDWDLATPGKPVIHCSNDPLLGGNREKHNPEDMLIAALSSCHMLWYLHLCSEAGIVVTAYEDNPIGIGEVEPSGKGRFLSAILKPRIEITPESDPVKAMQLHDEIHAFCFVARSVNFPVTYQPEIVQS